MPGEEGLATTDNKDHGSVEEVEDEENCWYVCGICSQALQELESLKQHRKREHPLKATQLIIFTQRELQPQIKLVSCSYKENQQNQVLESFNSVALDLETAGNVKVKPRRGRKPGRRQTVVVIEPKLCVCPVSQSSETPDRLQLHDEGKDAQREISKIKPSNKKPGVVNAQMLILTNHQLLWPQINMTRCDLNHQASGSCIDRQEGLINLLPEGEELEDQCSQNEVNQPRIKIEAIAEAPNYLVLDFPTNSLLEIQTKEVFTHTHDGRGEELLADSSEGTSWNNSVNPIPMDCEADFESGSPETPIIMCPPPALPSPKMRTCFEEESDQQQQQIQILDFDNEEHGGSIERKPDPPELDESADVQEDNVPTRTLRPRRPVVEVDASKSAKDTEFEMVYADPRPSSSLALQDEGTETVAKIEEEDPLMTAANSPCEICGQVVAHRWDVSIHKLLHIVPPGGKYPCEVCGKEYTFAALKHLRNHLMGHKELCFSCPICERTFTVRKYLENHLASHSRPRKGYLCPICGRSFRLPCLVKSHMKSHSAERPYKCTKCDASFKTRASLTKHNQVMHNGGLKPFSCPEPGCNKAFKIAKQLATHRKMVHLTDSSSPAPCPDCHRLYKNRESLRMHRRTAHLGHVVNKREFKCEFCQKSLGSKSSLEIHQLKEHGKPYEKPVECDVCRQQFTNLHKLKKHQGLKHSTELPFQCTICGKQYKCNSNLVTHLATHATEDEKRFQCHICGNKFALPHYLKQHARVHNPEIPPRPRRARCKKPRKELQGAEKASEESAAVAALSE